MKEGLTDYFESRDPREERKVNALDVPDNPDLVFRRVRVICANAAQLLSLHPINVWFNLSC